MPCWPPHVPGIDRGVDPRRSATVRQDQHDQLHRAYDPGEDRPDPSNSIGYAVAIGVINRAIRSFRSGSSIASGAALCCWPPCRGCCSRSCCWASRSWRASTRWCPWCSWSFTSRHSQRGWARVVGVDRRNLPARCAPPDRRRPQRLTGYRTSWSRLVSYRWSTQSGRDRPSGSSPSSAHSPCGLLDATCPKPVIASLTRSTLI